MTGADAHASLAALYDVAGQIRATLIALQAQIVISDAVSARREE